MSEPPRRPSFLLSCGDHTSACSLELRVTAAIGEVPDPSSVLPQPGVEFRVEAFLGMRSSMGEPLPHHSQMILGVPQLHAVVACDIVVRASSTERD